MLRPWKLEIHIDNRSDKAIYLQIADTIIEAIQEGRLKADDALPGSRALAALLQVNRNTVVEALSVLLNEGWIVSKERQGAFVSGALPRGPYRQSVTRLVHAPVATAVPERINITFDDGHPDSKIAPVKELARAYRQLFNRKARWKMMGYADALGDPAFRNAMAHMLNQQRGMHVDVDSICITRGSQMAMYLASRCLLKKGDIVAIEVPGYKPAWQALEDAGAALLPVPVDSAGLSVDHLTRQLKKGKKIKAVYITPHHQFPTTVTLSLERRLEMIQLSNHYGFTIIEDDYDNEFHFGYRPVLPLSSYAELENFVYIGTMSKVVAPALRLGYLVSNKSFINKTGQLRKLIDVQGDTIMEQAVLALIEDGTIRRHLKKATAYYRSKRDQFATLLQEHFNDRYNYQVPEGGLAFWLPFDNTQDMGLLCKRLLGKGVSIIHPDAFTTGPLSSVHGVRLGYASLNEQEMREGISALKQALSKR